jgi:hypothetical protein
VTRGTRPKKPSSSRGFARGARATRGTRGSWGLKTENRNIFSPLFQPATKLFLFIYFILFISNRQGPDGVLDGGARRVLDGVPEEGLDGVPDGARWGARRGA